MNNEYVNSLVETCLGTKCPDTIDEARRIFSLYGLEQPTNCDTLDYLLAARAGIDNHRARVRIKRLLNTMNMNSIETLDKLNYIEEVLS